MKLEEHIKNLQEIAQKYPNLDVVYSADDEGNSYGKIHYSPRVGSYNSGEREWIPESLFSDYEGDEENDNENKLIVNSVCVN